MILLAVIDDMAACAVSQGAFVSGDGIFDETVLQDACRTSKTKLHLFKTADALLDDIMRYADQTMQKVYELSEIAATKQVIENQARLQSFLEENLEIPVTFGGGFFSRRHLTKSESHRNRGRSQGRFPYRS